MVETLQTVGLALDFTQLQNGARQARTALESVAQAEDKVVRSTAGLTGALDKLELETGQELPRAVGRGSESWNQFDAALARALPRLDETATKVRRTGQEAENAGGKARKGGEGVTGFGTSLTGAAGAASRFLGIGGLLGGYLGGQFIREVTAAGVSAESLRASLTAITGSAAGTRQALGFVSQEANRLGLDYATLAESYKGLAAAARGTTLEGQQSREIFIALAEASRVYGLSQEQLSGALLAVQQIISKGTVSAEELRGQLGERLPGAFQVAARAVGVSTQELGKMLEQGQLLSADFLPKFATQLRRELAGGVEASTKTASANFARFSNDVQAIQEALANSGLLSFLGRAADAFGRVASEAVGAGRATRQALAEVDQFAPGADEATRQRFGALGQEIGRLRTQRDSPILAAIRGGSDPRFTEALNAQIRELQAQQTAILEAERRLVQSIGGGQQPDIPSSGVTDQLAGSIRSRITTAQAFTQRVDALGPLGGTEIDIAQTKLTQLKKTLDDVQESLLAVPIELGQSVGNATANEIGALLEQVGGLEKRIEELRATKRDAAKEERAEEREARQARDAELNQLAGVVEGLEQEIAQRTLSAEAYDRWRFDVEISTDRVQKHREAVQLGSTALRAQAQELYTRLTAIERNAQAINELADAEAKLFEGLGREMADSGSFLDPRQAQADVAALRQIYREGLTENVTEIDRALDVLAQSRSRFDAQLLEARASLTDPNDLRIFETEVERSFGRITDAADAFSASFLDAITSLAQGGKVSFKDFVNSVAADLLRLTTQQYLQPALSKLIQQGIGIAIGLFGGGSAAAASSITAAGGGGGALTFNAEGGPILKGTRSVTGERGVEVYIPTAGMPSASPVLLGRRGPELFIPPEDGFIFPAEHPISRAAAQHGLQRRQTGGPVNAGIPVLGGEAGVEAFVPSASLQGGPRPTTVAGQLPIVQVIVYAQDASSFIRSRDEVQRAASRAIGQASGVR